MGYVLAAEVRRLTEPSFMVLRLSDADREQLQARREQLELELRLVTATLRSDDALRLSSCGLRMCGRSCAACPICPECRAAGAR